VVQAIRGRSSEDARYSLLPINRRWVYEGGTAFTEPIIENNTLHFSGTDGGLISLANFTQTLNQCVSFDVLFPFTNEVIALHIRRSDSSSGVADYQGAINGGDHSFTLAWDLDGSFNNYLINYTLDPWPTNGWHNFKVCAIGTHIAAYLDDVVLGEADDAHVTSPGYARIEITRGSTVYIDNFKYVSFDTPPDNDLASLAPATLWIGLKNSDDQGTKFDLRTEVYINGTLISNGITRCITGVTRNPNQAKQVSVDFGSISDGTIESGDELSLKILTRIGTNPDDTKCSGHNNAVGLRLYYDAVSRPSRFGAEIAPDPLTNFFLHANALLDDSAPTATTAQFKDSASVNFVGGNPWKEIGTWIMILP
jgi:hypothetical protein